VRAFRLVAIAVTLVRVVGFAEEPEIYELPNFDPPDAGVVAAPTPMEPPAPPPAAPTPRPLPPPSWGRISGAASLLATAFTQVFVGADVGLFGTIAGTPADSAEHPGFGEGWLLQVGAHAAWGAVASEWCRGTPLCGSRGLGGLALKGGWARGRLGLTDAVAHPQTMYFAQLDVALSHFSIESAPLSPGRRTWEFLTRVRLGLHWTSPDAASSTGALRLVATIVLEAIPVSDGTQTVSLGASVGLGF
jgi:hypothetical protein